VYEERSEQVPVQVCKWVTEAQTVREPRTVASWKPYEAQQCVPRTVVMRVPLDPCYSDLPTTTYYYPAPATVVAPPAAPPAASSGATTRQRVPTEAEQPEKSVLKDGNKANEKQPAEAPAKAAPETKKGETPAEAEKPAAEPKDSDPTGTPLLRLEDLKLSPAGPGSGDDTARPAAGKSA